MSDARFVCWPPTRQTAVAALADVRFLTPIGLGLQYESPVCKRTTTFSPKLLRSLRDNRVMPRSFGAIWIRRGGNVGDLSNSLSRPRSRLAGSSEGFGNNVVSLWGYVFRLLFGTISDC